MREHSSTSEIHLSHRKDKPLTPEQQLAALLFEEKKTKHPTIPVELLPQVSCSGRTKFGLTRCAYDKLRLSGHPVKLHPKCRRETPYDIETVLNGRTFYILAVPGQLVQNTAQYRFQRKVENQGAGYICIKSYSEFLMVYSTIMEAATAQTVPA